MNAGRAPAAASRARLEQERTQIARRLDGLYDAIAYGLRTSGLKEKLEELEGRRPKLDEQLAAPAPAPVRLHPDLSAIYRRKVEELGKTLADPETRPMAIEAIRGDGAITALVGLAQPEAGKSLCVGSVQVVAGGAN